MRLAIILLTAALLAVPAPGARAGPGPLGLPVTVPLTPRFVNATHNGSLVTPCCGAFNATVNATDPDNSGLYNTLDVVLRANATNDSRPLFPKAFPFQPRAPAFPEAYAAFVGANVTGRDWYPRTDVFDRVVANASVQLATAHAGRYRVAVGVVCVNADATPGPESCAPDAPVVDVTPP